jgi:Mg2+ and Co2+ transporter CorA
MTPIEIANMTLGIFISIGTVISLAALGIRWLVKHYFDEIKKELKPNHGSSIKDQVTRLEQKVEEAETKRKAMSQKIDHMYDLLLDFFSDQASKK